MSTPLLQVEHLTIRFGADEPVVRDVSFSLARGRTLALVGESGSGKSLSALAIPRLLPGTARMQGTVMLEGQDLARADAATLRRVRGGALGMVFQEPMTSLNPLHRVERQIAETLRVHQKLDGPTAAAKVRSLLERVGLHPADRIAQALPHELSGGQRQRVMIAMALANEPHLLIADEPTTALDVTVQAEILALIQELRDAMGLAVLFITHDLRLVARLADDVAVMRHGTVVEQGTVAQVLNQPVHDATKALLAAKATSHPAMPAAPDTAPVLEAQDVRVSFPGWGGLLRKPRAPVDAVDGVSLSLRPGETLGLVGESGSGKTTLTLALLRLIQSTGAISLDGQRIDGLGFKALRPLRRRMQVVFQDPFASLSPRMSVAAIIGEGLDVHRLVSDPADREARIIQAMQEVGLDPATRHRFPHEFSGGQRQRVALARALVLEPAVLLLDEPTSALDVTVQAQVVDLLRAVQERRGLAYLFISHDLGVVRALASHLLVLRDGNVVEQGEAAPIFANPTQTYTRELLRGAGFVL